MFPLQSPRHYDRLGSLPEREDLCSAPLLRSHDLVGVAPSAKVRKLNWRDILRYFPDDQAEIRSGRRLPLHHAAVSAASQSFQTGSSPNSRRRADTSEGERSSAMANCSVAVMCSPSEAMTATALPRWVW